MTNSGSRLGFTSLTVALTLTVAACSSDNDTPAATGGAPGAGGVPAAGGMPAAGGVPPAPTATGGMSAGGVVGTGGVGAGGPSTGGAGGSGEASGGAGGTGAGGLPEPYVCSTRPAADPGATGASGDACCSGAGKCADPTTLTGDAARSYGHDTCGPTLRCAPPAPSTAPATCTTKAGTSAVDGIEGRCVPRCFLLGSALAVLLDDGGTCPANQLCTPCFNPVDGKSTGACSTGTDQPVKPAPTPYVSCPSGNDQGQNKGGGLCVPSGVITKLSDKTNPLYNPAIPGLLQDNCADGEKCVPAFKAADPGYCSAHCTTAESLRSINKDLYSPGACTPEYVIWDTNGTTGVNLVSGPGATACSAGELCAPCANPLTAGTPSGACY